MKRLFDIVVSMAGLIVLAGPMLLTAILVKLSSEGTILYWSKRVGRNGRTFLMPKFRTMQTGTPAVATHLLEDSGRYGTPVGAVLRRTSLDELPQLWCILKGDMSVVGPRPALFNQDDLIASRAELGVDRLPPGLTGWAQVNGRDELSIRAKVELDAEYLRRRSFTFDLKIIALTVVKVAKREGVVH